MLDLARRLKPEQWYGLLFVLVLHGAVLYTLWGYRIIPAPSEAVVLIANLVNPAPQEQPKPKKPELPKPRPPDVPPPEHQHLAVETPVVLPDDPVTYVPPEPVVEAPPLPPQPVMLPNELSVSCPERSPPDYPSLSIRMNEQGKVVLRVELGEDGHIRNAEVKASSGFRRLDEAALDTVRTWRCRPVIRNGVAVSAVALQPFNFILEGR